MSEIYIKCVNCGIGFKGTKGLCPSCVSDCDYQPTFNGECGYAKNDNSKIVEYNGMGANV